ncbi:SDR family NAD(P)-dependent oxidoreductase [Dankookia rubra]|uniref:SDR family NAD(P)-dependent oxidoreductase n=1 Tax=Dankookia rubra TaxID=1442381 RepID=A0A4R5Q6Q4_9PROT|nr:SDR family NAD(P)-dependent oxidoreductase [Dankookia rubra]TDH58376.1 SDR family NAD(P)-dependent oxidoreductase [Dankookia rubra]
MIVLVTGATAGFDLAIASRFAADGVRIVVLGRRAERVAALAAELGPGRVYPPALDFTDRAAVDAGLPPALAEVDVLVNNAGMARGLEPAQAADLDDWDAIINTNVKGLIYTEPPNCLVAEHCWDPLGLAIVDHAYRFPTALSTSALVHLDEGNPCCRSTPIPAPVEVWT